MEMSNHKILVVFENWKNIKQLKFVAKIGIMTRAKYNTTHLDWL